MKKGIFSNGKSKKPSGATNQDTKKDNETVSIEQELKLESKNNALNLASEIYPKFYNLTSKDKQLLITLLSNAKNIDQDIKTFNQVLKTEAKKLAI